MNTHDIELPPLPDFAGRSFFGRHMVRKVKEAMEVYATAAIEADRERKQSEAEEVCGEAYQVVGSLLSDLGIFETDHAKKILDNLSQAKMVHKDVLPWPSFDRQRGGEPVYLLAETNGMWSETNEATFLWWKANSPRAARVLYATPQPAESCASLISDKPVCGSENEDCDSQPTKLVKGLSAEQLAEILTAYITPEIIGEALEKLENAPWELSAPVKMPSKLSNAEILSLAYDVGAMPEQATDATLVRFARALLARYGQAAHQGGQQ